MTTSLSKSTIPAYDPTNSYSSPRQVPRVKFEGREIYEKNRGSLNISDWSIQSKDWESPRPLPKVKYEEAQKSYIKNRGCMNEIMSGYLENPPVIHKGPRIKREAEENYVKNKGTFNTIINDYGRDIKPEIAHQKVQYEGRNNRKAGEGSVGNLLGNYGYHPLSARPVPRVKFEGSDNYENNRGSGISKTLKMVPLTFRPSSSTFFDNR